MIERIRVLWGAVLCAFVLGGCVGSQIPGKAHVPSDATVTHRAALIGESYHDVTGTITLYQSDSYPVIVFEPNFRFQGADSAVVALGRDGYRADTALGALLKNTGRQAYAIPRDIEVRRFNEVWIWNEEEDIPLGLGRLTPIPADQQKI